MISLWQLLDNSKIAKSKLQLFYSRNRYYGIDNLLVRKKTLNYIVLRSQNSTILFKPIGFTLSNGRHVFVPIKRLIPRWVYIQYGSRTIELSNVRIPKVYKYKDYYYIHTT